MATSTNETLSTHVKVLLDKIVSNHGFMDNFRTTKLDLSLLKKLEKKLLRILDVLHYASVADVNEWWLDTLRYALFEVDNLFYEIKTEALRCKVEAEHQIATTSQVHYLYSPFTRFDRVSNSQMQKLIGRLEFLSSIYRRNNDVKKLKHLLFSNDGDDQIRIISIVGMVGIGKTALAKLLYNDPHVKDKFELKLWVDMSKYYEDFVDISVFETNIKSITSHAIINHNLDAEGNIDVNIVYPNFLLVLDDVLDARSVNWTLLMDMLNAQKTGSTIIITTRDERVPKSMESFFYVHYLRPLESEDCWSIVARHAFGPRNYQKLSNLEEIGRKIAEKCDGLPLAAVTVASFLREEFSQDYWNNVLIRDIWELVQYVVQPALQSSYNSLSAPLKQCFEYCSIFPKKYILEKNVVVQLWIAEGLVESSADQEKVGEEYFDELVSRSLIHRQSIGNEEANFEMHSLLHDFATMVSSSYCTSKRSTYLSSITITKTTTFLFVIKQGST
ncbi:NB-ARC domain disease resistance protein [Medicago truncatula]|uniref:NB-ARC domain disease resistance protein n=1 Tax=Medicago truncatula TaxID=3880 RepID=G7IYW6_MEDTR|nr:NB-ARC domain disease resistance protein [Medicago truncatula]